MNIRLIKGFTLIELLIVIAIIAVLAVAFVPALLGSPAKARDAARISDIQRMDTVLAARDLEDTTALPVGAGCIDNTLFAAFVPKLGGSVPMDPQAPAERNYTTNANFVCAKGNYYYKKAPDPAGKYEYVLMALVEDRAKANTTCSAALNGVLTSTVANASTTEFCYAVLRAK